jgi:hypothetical protein
MSESSSRQSTRIAVASLVLRCVLSLGAVWMIVANAQMQPGSMFASLGTVLHIGTP